MAFPLMPLSFANNAVLFLTICNCVASGHPVWLVMNSVMTSALPFSLFHTVSPPIPYRFPPSLHPAGQFPSSCSEPSACADFALLYRPAQELGQTLETREQPSPSPLELSPDTYT